MSEYLIETRDLAVSFGHVHALRGVNLRLRPGRITALVGDNGAGKSTLVKVLSGVQRPTSGSILLEGREHSFTKPADAHAAGIEVVYQDLAVAPDMSSVENLFLGRYLRKPGLLGRLGVIDRKRMRHEAQAAFDALGMTVQDIDKPVIGLSGGQRQGVAVCRASIWASRLVIFDEPTAALGVVQTEKVVALIRGIRARGIAVLVISHDLPQVLEIADDIVVLRQGRDAAELDPASSSVRELVDYMTGAKEGGRAA
ncbi:ATP-binding cassette domain-containing protein [Ruicaihuangia caeni]